MNERAHYIRQERFPAREIIVPVGGYCYGRDVGEGFCENKLKEVDVSVVAGAGPTLQLEPRQNGDPHGLARLCYWVSRRSLAGEPGRET